MLRTALVLTLALAGPALGATVDDGLRRRVEGRVVFIGSSAGLDARVMTPDGQRAATASRHAGRVCPEAARAACR